MRLLDSTTDSVVINLSKLWKIVKDRKASILQSMWSQRAANDLEIEQLLRCIGFARIQKAVVDQTGSRPPNSDHELFLMQIWLWEVFWSFFSVQPLS